MIHDTKNYLKLNKERKKFILNGLEKLKIQKIIKKYGFSIYTEKELNELIKLKKFDIIQFPGNIFDQSILNNKNIYFLKKRGIELHARSIFLQGLIFLKFDKTKKVTGVYSKKLKKFYDNFKTKEQKIFHCINFIKNHEFIDKVVIGITSFNELKQIMTYLEKKLNKRNYSEFIIKNQKIYLSIQTIKINIFFIFQYIVYIFTNSYSCRQR